MEAQVKPKTYFSQTACSLYHVKVSARDVDTGMGGSVRYSCGGGCDRFNVRSMDGAVVLTKPLDAEVATQHDLIVVATDSGIPQLSSTATVVIHGKYIYELCMCV